MSKEAETPNVSVENIYKLDGRVPLSKAIPFGLQHVLAMFVSNLVPVLLVCSVAYVNGKSGGFSASEIASLLQCAMFAAGIGTCVQLYPVWKIGSKLPVVMGVSFTFVASLMTVAQNPEWGYTGMIGAIIVGGIFEGCLGLTAKYWKKFISPIVSACVVTTIGFSLLSVGMNSFAGGQGAADYGAWYHLVVAIVTLVACLVFNFKAKGVWKNLNVLFGLAVGYLLSVIFTVTGVAKMIDFASFQKTIQEIGFISIPMAIFQPSILAQSLPLESYFWYPLPRQSEIQQPSVPEVLDEILQNVRFRVPLPVTVSEVPFPVSLDVIQLHHSART